MQNNRSNEHELLAAQLDATGDYRVLRRVKPRTHYDVADGSPTKIGICLDIETTGLDQASSEVIELGMIKFEFSSDGRIFNIIEEFQSFQEPLTSVSSEITRLTGITNSIVKGNTIDQAAVSEFVKDAAIIIAHNAQFDRPFCERIAGVFADKAWACSMSEIAWPAEGLIDVRLGSILAEYRLFIDAHRSVEDCRGLIEILARPLPISQERALKTLLDHARIPTARIWAEGAPYESRDVLKRRGYKWSDGMDGRRRAWWIEVPEPDAVYEYEFLVNNIYGQSMEIPIERITAFSRYSNRKPMVC